MIYKKSYQNLVFYVLPGLNEII